MALIRLNSVIANTPLIALFSASAMLVAVTQGQWAISLPQAFYFPYRASIEIFLILIYTSIFVVGWWSPEPSQDKRLERFAVGFLLVGLFNLGHALSSPGMPDFITANSIEKSVAFLLAARALESALLLIFAVTEDKWVFSRVPRGAILAGLVGGVAVFTVILGFPSFFPKFYANGQATAIKLGTEYLISGLLVLAEVIYLVRLRNRYGNWAFNRFSDDEIDFLFILLFAVLAGWIIASHHSTADLPSAVGHGYRALDAVLIFRYVFIRSIREPYKRLREVQHALRQSEQKYEEMINSLQEAVMLVSSVGEILEVNQAVCDLTGYTRTELLGMSVAYLFAPVFTTGISPSSADDLWWREGVPWEAESRCHNGEVIPVEVRARRAANYTGKAFLLTVNDLRDRREAWKQKERAQAFFDGADEGIVVADAQGVIETVNAALTEITGFLPEEIIGSRPERLLSPDSDLTREEYEAIVRVVRATGKWRGEIWGRRKDGSRCPLWVTVTGLRDTAGRVQYYSAIFSDLSIQQQLEQRLRHQITHDPVTGLPNRFYYLEHLPLLLRRSEGSTGHAVLMLNVKGMKEINAICGLAGGDRVLKEVADRLAACSSEREVLGRWEGDEFIMVLPGVDAAEELLPVLRRIQEAVSTPLLVGKREIWANLAIGIALGRPEEEVDNLLRAAEFAMDEARKEPGTTYHFYQPGMQELVLERLAWERSLRLALANKEILVYYQPQVCPRTDTVIGLEALVRWQHPELGLVSPARFIPLAEESGLIVPLGEEVLRQACAQAKTWLCQGLPLAHLAVNISAKQFRHPDFVDMVRRVVRETDISPSILVLEITESTAMQDIEFTQRIINSLRADGISFALDDFGTGYSSLNYLKKFPVEWLKIDRSFIKDILVNAQDAAIVEAMVQLARGLHLKLIAEGVEEADQLTLLEELGCDIVQGYLFSPPLPPQGIPVFFSRGKHTNAIGII